MGAPLNPVPNVVRVFLEGWIDNDHVFKWGNVLHFDYSGTVPSNAVCATIAANIDAAWSANVASLCPAPTMLTNVVVTDLSSPTAGEGQSTTSHIGTRGDDSIPANAAVLVSYPSALRYKGGHPRTYLYVLGNADLEGAAHWSTAGAAEVATKWQAFLTACLAAGASGTVLSAFVSIRYKGKFLPNGGPPHYYLTNPLVNTIPIASAVAQTEMASQRRRVGRVRK
jgi:hypothetical protein